ncbi:MAG: signal recognition particle-docking protein FtsY [Burkholderiales bacterium]
MAKPVEQRHTHPVGRGAQVRARGDAQAPPAVLAADDAHTARRGALARIHRIMVAATSWATRLRSGLGALFGRAAIDESLYEALEDAMLAADCGVAATRALLERLRERARRERIADPQVLRRALREELRALLAPLEKHLDLERPTPIVVMVAGVNGAGKTTSIGKLAKWLQAQGRSVLLAAGDTFRAAAREQLEAWGERNGVAVIAQRSGDAAAVAFDAVAAARARGLDVLIVDTAGRLATQLHLMEEIRKVKRVLGKALAGAPHEVLLVLDANTGQNALAQVNAFDEALGLTGLILTKLDGTARGGVVCAIARERPVPLLFVGIGEGLEDLRPFDAAAFAEALL